MKRRSAPVRLLFDLFGMNIRNMSTDGVTVSCPLRKNLKPGPVRSYACWGLGCSSSPVSSHCARRRWAQFAFRILRKPAVRVVRGRSSGVRRATDHRISPVLVERGGSDHRAVRVDPGGPRLGPHGRSQTYERVGGSMDAIPLGRLVFGVLVAIRLYLTYVGWAAGPASPAAKNTP